MMTGERVGVGHDPSRGAAYVEVWVAALEEDPREIRRAAGPGRPMTSGRSASCSTRWSRASIPSTAGAPTRWPAGDRIRGGDRSVFASQTSQNRNVLATAPRVSGGDSLRDPAGRGVGCTRSCPPGRRSKRKKGGTGGWHEIVEQHRMRYGGDPGGVSRRGPVRAGHPLGRAVAAHGLGEDGQPDGVGRDDEPAAAGHGKAEIAAGWGVRGVGGAGRNAIQSRADAARSLPPVSTVRFSAPIRPTHGRLARRTARPTADRVRVLLWPALQERPTPGPPRQAAESGRDTRTEAR